MAIGPFIRGGPPLTQIQTTLTLYECYGVGNICSKDHLLYVRDGVMVVYTQYHLLRDLLRVPRILLYAYAAKDKMRKFSVNYDNLKIVNIVKLTV